MLFNQIVFGPVQSRRLGISLGVNLLPPDAKFCNFNCIYCECGWTKQKSTPHFPSVDEVVKSLSERLQTMKAKNAAIDVITFAGNGEPTIHPEFATIIDRVIEIRNTYYPHVKIAVLTNATLLHVEKVRSALQRIELPILKLDSAIDSTLQLINQPQANLTVERIVKMLRQFNHPFTLQTLFFRGNYEGVKVDNTTPEEVEAWLNVVKDLQPARCQIYTIDRETPEPSLERIPLIELQQIGKRVEDLGISIQVNG